MDNAQKAIMIGVGLFITIIIITAVLLLTNMGSTLTKKSSSDIGAITDDMQNQLIKDYGGKLISAPEAIAIAKKYYNSNNVSIYFYNGTTYPSLARMGQKGIVYGGFSGKIGDESIIISSTSNMNNFRLGTPLTPADEGDYKSPLSDFEDKTSPRYVAPGSKYYTSVIRYGSITGPVIGIGIQKAN